MIKKFKKLKLILLGIIIILNSCSEKEVPPIAEAPRIPPKIEEKKEMPRVKKKEESDLVKILSEEREVKQGIEPTKREPTKGEPAKMEPAKMELAKMEDWETWKLYGRSTPPLLAIFFDYDDFTIREDMWNRIVRNVKYLMENPMAKVELQGNCDERGTNEYNMALGMKRALEVKKVLVKLGIEEDRINVISFGEERPLCKVSDESCWAINRRVDFVIR